jgi:hypothetical protein
MDLIGWTGVIVYVTAYAFLSAGWLKSDRIHYHLLNAIGGLSLVIYSSSSMDMPNLIVNAVWLTIAMISMARIMINRRKT